jgi:hypothetical protein
VSVLLGYGTASLDDWCLTIQGSMEVLSSIVKMSDSLRDVVTLEAEITTLSENIRQQSPTDLVACHRRRKNLYNIMVRMLSNITVSKIQ